ncbi:IS1239, transposase, putative [Streptococcus pneumoniae]|nr:IS1239, transposase, putative [Streptococcus pneumoniae]
MQDNYTTKAKHLTIDSRRLIERWKKEGKSNREIASLLGKAPQTIHTEIKRGTVRQCLGKGRFKEVYSADYAQQSYENNRKRSVKKSSLTKELKEKILHYHNQKFSPEMMVMAKGVNVGISTIYYWIHHGKLGLSKQDLLYPRKGKALKKQASTNFKPAGQSIEQRSEAAEDKACNHALSKERSKVENIFAKVKTFKMFSTTYRNHRKRFGLRMNLSAGIINHELGF